MANSESTNRSETVPAATLLFQAPQFLEPTTPAPKRQFSAGESNRSETGERTQERAEGREQYRGRWQKQANTDLVADKVSKRTLNSESDTDFDQRDRVSSKSRKKSRGFSAELSFADSSSATGSTTVTAKREFSSRGSRDTRDTNMKEMQPRWSRTEHSLETKTGSVQNRGKSPIAQTESEAPRAGESATYEESSSKRRRRRTRSYESVESTSSHTSHNQDKGFAPDDGVTALRGSTRLEAKRIRRRETRRERRRRYTITEAEFLARRESVDRQMVVRHLDGLEQIAVLEDGVLVEHYVANRTQQSIVGNVYLGRVHNVLPSMEAAFVDIGRGRNAVLYAGEVNWSALGVSGNTPRRIESALKPGDTVLVQVTKDAIGHKGARLTSQISLAGRYLVLVPGSSTLGISRKLPDSERMRLKKLLRQNLPENAGVIVRTASEGASEEQLLADIERLSKQWESIQQKQRTARKAPILLRSEPELAVRVVRDIFNEDFSKLIIQGKETWDTVSKYVNDLSPELSDRLEYWTGKDDLFHEKRIDQQLAKGMDRKVWLPSGGTLIIDRTEAMTVIDVNTGKFIGSGGTLEETVTRNNLEAAEEIVRQLRLRDIGGMIIIDFVDMVLESNRELVLRRLIECLTRDRTRHQVTEVTSLGLVQMTRKRVGEGLVEAFSTPCEHCEGRGFIVHDRPIDSAEGSVSKKREWHNHGEAIRKSARQLNRERDREVQVQIAHVDDEQAKSAVSVIAAASEKSAIIEKPNVDANADINVTQNVDTDGKKSTKETRKKRRRVVSTGANEPSVQAPVQSTVQVASSETSESEPPKVIDLPKTLAESSQTQIVDSSSKVLAPAVLAQPNNQVTVARPARRRRRVVVSAEVVSPTQKAEATSETSSTETA